MAKKKRKKKSKGMTALLTILILLCVVVMSYSAYRLITTAIGYKKGADEYSALREFTTLTGESGTASATIVEVMEAEEVFYVPPCPLTVDWDALKKKNEDIVGWLHIGAIDASYPIVRGTDNEFYLHHTFEKNYLFAGSIFMEYQNKADFSDPNSIIYGHNMLDGSMFGKLKKITNEELFKKDPYFWILTPKGDYCYKMFSAHIAAVDSEVYTLFKGTDEKFVEWAEEMRRRSDIEVDLENYVLDKDSHIATLSTCTDNSATRYVVMGLRLN